MQVHLIQHDIAWENAKETFAKVLRLIEGKSFPRGDLLVLPEMFAVGFSMNAELVGEKEDGPTTQFLRQLATSKGVYVIGGVPIIVASGRVQNQAICLNDRGEVVARYAKMQPFTPAGETDNYEAGTTPVVFDWNGIKVAPLICYDLRFPEVFRAAARLGAEMFCVIANWPSPRASHRDILLPARALENQAYVAGVNRVGSDPKCQYTGHSRVIDPTGQLIADAGEIETVLSVPIDPKKVREFRSTLPFLADMRDDLVPPASTP
jgi:predicted amidohydrolase